MRLTLTLLLLLAVVGCNMTGCQGVRPKISVVNISLKNSFTNDLDWVQLDWSGPHVPGGIIPPGVSKTAVGVSWPNLPSAKLTFVDDKTRQRYNIGVSFVVVNAQVRTGKCKNVTIRILSYDKADVICE